ncbi:MAG: hydrogenase iron-sulfur subunit [Candidatus Thorarchaeota archaeon]
MSNVTPKSTGVSKYHYTSGNLKMESRYTMLKVLLKQAGISPERVHLQGASAVEGEVFND